MRQLSRTVAFLIVWMLASGVAAPAQGPVARKNDYADGGNWLCRPGRQDACAVDLTTTVIAADGTLTREEWKADPNAAVDCFYVYPTVSADPTPNSDMNAGPEERRIVRSQFARFASHCRVYAPMYRQVSLMGLRAGVFGPIDGSDLLSRASATRERAIAYNDVRDAWSYYLQHDNHGRGVVLIGHSQGSFLLAELIQHEIEGRPVQAHLVSAILLGMSLPVPNGKDGKDDVGGAFQRVPLCHAAGQIGCVVSYAAFRSTVPPPPNTLFGRVAGNNMIAACTNPAAVSGGRSELHAYFDAVGHPFTSSAAPVAWTTAPKPMDTPFVSVPGLLEARCLSNEHGSYLEVTVRGDPTDPRADDIVGDMKTDCQVNAAWGLHLIDVNLTMGNLLDLVREQAAAYRVKK